MDGDVFRYPSYTDAHHIRKYLYVLARKRRKKQVSNREMAAEYEFGIRVEQVLEEEFATIIEEKRKKAVYEELTNHGQTGQRRV